MALIFRSLWATAFLLLNYLQVAEAARRYSRRSDLVGVPPVSDAGWLVPLQGGRTCRPGVRCTDSLTPPPADNTLAYIALGRGVYTFTCEGKGSSEVPMYQSQSTQLYDAASLVPRLGSEEAFHSLVPQLYNFDYSELKNSTLECMGTIGTINDTAIVTLFEIATYEARAFETILPPDDHTFNGRWAHSRSPGKSWHVYRVEMTGGAPPICGNEATTLEIGYAAEYWFYHSKGEDLRTDVDNDNSEDPLGDSRNTKLMI